ncbi:hypothetical protein M1512_01045 [Patescibacteria group bacterium]|nr:hypothetical protein [Patescibacteria group bacterium]
MTKQLISSQYLPSDTEVKLLKSLQEYEKEHKHKKLHTNVDIIEIAHKAYPEIDRQNLEQAFVILKSNKFFDTKNDTLTAAQQNSLYPSLAKKNHFRTVKTTYFSLGGNALLFLEGRYQNNLSKSSVNVYDHKAKYKARRKFEELFESAKNHIKIEDNYIGRRTLDLLISANDVPIQIITSAIQEKNFPNALTDFKRDYHNTIKIKISNEFHGRFMIVDDQVYLVDQSIKDFGEKPSAFIKIEDDRINKLYIKYFSDAWKD